MIKIIRDSGVEPDATFTPRRETVPITAYLTLMASKKTTRRTKAEPTEKPGAYPFASKAEVRDRVLSGDRAFILTCLRIMQKRTEERAAGRAPRPNRWGWGSADAAAGAGALAERLLGGRPAYGDQKKAVALIAKYTVQIAEALRLETMAKNPEMVRTAKVYGVAPSRRPPRSRRR